MTARVGMVFGVFDGLHDGHKHFLETASMLCEKLIVVVTRDEVSLARKGFKPKREEKMRINELQEFNTAFSVVLGDEADGQWHIIDAYDPERVFLGYDQHGMQEPLKKMGIPFTFLDAYKADIYKSSIINEGR